MRFIHLAAMLLAAASTQALAHGEQPPAQGEAATVSAAPVPVEQLAVPPATADSFLLLSTAGQHGTAFRWRDANGDSVFRESMNLRGQVFEQDARIATNAAGQIARYEVRGFTPSGNAAELFSFADGMARWSSPVDRGEVASDGTSLYSSFGGPFMAASDFAERVLAAPGHRLAMLPGGEARAEQIATAMVGSNEVQLWAITGLSLSAFPIWMDDGKFFAITSWISLMPQAARGEMERLQQIQDEAMARRNPAFVQRFGQMPATPVAFEHVRLFDSIEGVWRDDQTVVVEGRLISSIGPSASTTVPANARRIDGSGKSLVPGLWDAHMHMGDDASGPMLLSLGVTNARDPGADVQPALARQQRFATGQLLSPTVFTSVLIDGAGPLAAQGGVTVTSAEEAVAAVRTAHDNGFRAIKFYTSMHPDWLRAGIDEAHRLGMHVHGHVPATMRAMDAIDAGYDEITHINFIAMQAMPDSVVNVSNGFARFEGPGRYARTLDLTAPPISTLITRMATEGIVSDPTLVAFEGILNAEAGQISPSYAAFSGTLPPQTERGFRAGGFAPPADLTRADYQASFAKLVELVGRMQAAGVPIVAGTDGSGLEIVHELELYVQAGMSTAEALQAATIRPARLVGADNSTGSITVGKEADLVLVDGDPSQRIGALRHTVWVMTDGKLIDANALREAVGFSGPPR